MDKTAMIRRHDFIWPGEQGRRAALSGLQCAQDVRAAVEALLLSGVPGIVCRQENAAPGHLQLGFASHTFLPSGARLRIRATIGMEEMARIQTPFDVLAAALENAHALPPALGALLREIASAMGDCGMQAGVFGSAALQLVTGLPYLHGESDVDVLLRPVAAQVDLQAAGRALAALEMRTGTRVDAEYLHGAYGIKLKEWMGNSRTVLGKALYDVALLRRDEIAP